MQFKGVISRFAICRNLPFLLKKSQSNKNSNLILRNISDKNFGMISNKTERFSKPLNHNKSDLIQNKSIRFSSTHSEHLKTKSVSVPVGWGNVEVQIFGNMMNKKATPIICVHGYLDNSNSFKPIAEHMCGDEYYMIAIDLPGHGLSSKLPQGVPYTPKLFLTAVRRVVKYFELEKFIFMTHSYGGLIGLLYSTVFQTDVTALVQLDWVFGYSQRKWTSVTDYWRQGIDRYIKEEANLVIKKEEEKKLNRPPLTHELATKILMKANKHLDENAASLLIERATIQDENGNLQFSRDPFVQITMSERDHYVDIRTIFPDVSKFLTTPALNILSDPPSYGKQTQDDTMRCIDLINEKSNTEIIIKYLNGTHHVHMIKPKEMVSIILEFLDSLKVEPSMKL